MWLSPVMGTLEFEQCGERERRKREFRCGPGPFQMPMNTVERSGREQLHMSPGAEDMGWGSGERRRAGGELVMGVAEVPTQPVWRGTRRGPWIES